MPDELGKDGVSVSSLQRKHANFENDLQTLGSAVSWLFFFIVCVSSFSVQFNRHKTSV